ncbi:alpha-ribazole phosphatase family protein [Pseudomonas cremoricolorata]|uniref:alpha-ribazole phosphatase family protein n=1 Tax=Pseudomonas cremoricolorata TaxID=157783 RepID=UPI000675E4B9|nr:alpha-ribazole phosphatase family protein [Pseudomonas cremoricolorata]
MILDLLRHGETELGGGLRGSLDDALTERGWQQMHEAVVAGGPWDVLLSSPLQRCARFAEALAERLQLPVQLAPAWRELHFGAWEGRSAAHLMQTDAEALGRFWADPYSCTPPGGEPVAAFATRVHQALAALRQEHVGQRVLVVTHGGVMRLLLAQARGLPREQLLQVEVGHGALLRLDLDAFDQQAFKQQAFKQPGTPS